jgi:hypothetical protein
MAATGPCRAAPLARLKGAVGAARVVHRAEPALWPWATRPVHTGRASAVGVGHTRLCNWAERGFGPVAVELNFLFFEYIEFLANSKICVGFI